MTKIDLITGILGSGKTTFILSYARHLMADGARVAVLENDFGAVNIDMMMLQELKAEGCQLEMVSGGCDADCHRRRFKTQLIALGMQHPDRVIVEPSGIFDMDEFFDILHESPLDRWFEPGSVITVCDAEMPEELTAQMEYLLGSQAACCGKIVLSRADRNDPDIASITAKTRAHLDRALEKIKCRRRIADSDIIIKSGGVFSDADYEALMNAGHRPESYVKLFSGDDIESGVHYFMNIRLPEDRIVHIIESIMNAPECGDIFRIKGALPVGDGYLRINATRHKTELSHAGEGQSVLIVIGDNVNKAAIDARLVPENTDPDYTSI